MRYLTEYEIIQAVERRRVAVGGFAASFIMREVPYLVSTVIYRPNRHADDLLIDTTAIEDCASEYGTYDLMSLPELPEEDRAAAQAKTDIALGQRTCSTLHEALTQIGDLRHALVHASVLDVAYERWVARGRPMLGAAGRR